MVKPKILWSVFLIASLLLLTVNAVLAQTLDAIFVSEDGTFQISYPDTWSVDSTDPAFAVIGGRISTATFAVTVFSTDTVSLFSIGESSAVAVALNVAEAVEFVESDAEEFPIGDRDAALASVDLDGQSGVAFVIEMDNGKYGMVIVLATIEALEKNVDFIVSMVESYNIPAQGVKGTSATPATLTSFDADWETAVAELQDLELIGTGGSLVFEEDSAFFTGQGYFFTPLGRRSPYADVVMAGELDFTSGSTSEYEQCSLIARVVDSGSQTVSTYLQVGIGNNQDISFYDNDGSQDTSVYDEQILDIDLSEPHHILFIAKDESLTIYIDGELLFDTVQVTDERAGTYGIALLGEDRASRCEGSNIWVYQVPSFEPGVCEITSNGSVNKRTGPSTNFDRAGTLEAGTIQQAIGQNEASDGFRWWELEDGTWVREDIVNVAGDCASVPDSE